MNIMLPRLLSRNRIFFSAIWSPWLVWLRVCLVVSIFATCVLWPTGRLFAAEQTIEAQSCAFSSIKEAVQTAIDSKTNSLIIIPSGTCDWTSNVLKIPGGISLKGAGKTSTVLQGNPGTNATLITVDCSNGKTSRVSDMTLIGKGDATTLDGGLAFLNGCADFMVFNSTFRDFVGSGITVRGNARGVIFQNDFLDNYRADPTRMATGYGVVVYGNGTWPPLELGTANAVFVESNHFSGNRHSIASNNGSRYVFRYNTVIGVDLTRDFSMVDAHGLTYSPRGSRSWEIYNNTFTTKHLTPNHARSVVGIRGGDGVMFNNTLTNPATVVTMIELWAENASTYPGPDQMTSGYFWNNTPNTIRNSASNILAEGRDYFLYARPGYTPYTYPHPLRSTLTATPP